MISGISRPFARPKRRALNGKARPGGPSYFPGPAGEKVKSGNGSELVCETASLLAGTFVKFERATIKDPGDPTQSTKRAILVLSVAGEERSLWLNQTALYSKIREALLDRSSRMFEPGEQIVIKRLEKKKSEGGLN